MDRDYFTTIIVFMIGAYFFIAPFLPSINPLDMSSMGIFWGTFFFFMGTTDLYNKSLFSKKIYYLTALLLVLVFILLLNYIGSMNFVLFIIAFFAVFLLIVFPIYWRERSKFNKGIALVNNGKYQEALDYFDNYLKSNSNDPFACSGKAIALTELDRYEDALKCANKAVNINIGVTKKFLLKEIINSTRFDAKSLVLTYLKEYDEALEYVDKSLKLSPGNIYALNHKGVILSELGNYSEAINYYDRALNFDPENVILWVNKGIALAKLENYQEAMDCCDKAIEIDPEFASAWLNKGYAIEKLGKHEEARECYEKVLELYSKQEPWELKKALKYYNRILEIDPEDAIWFGKGVVLGSLEKTQEALECLDKTLELNSRFETAIKAKAYFHLDRS